MLGYFNHLLSVLSHRKSIMKNQHECGFSDGYEAVLHNHDIRFLGGNFSSPMKLKIVLVLEMKKSIVCVRFSCKIRWLDSVCILVFIYK